MRLLPSHPGASEGLGLPWARGCQGVRPFPFPTLLRRNLGATLEDAVLSCYHGAFVGRSVDSSFLSNTV